MMPVCDLVSGEELLCGCVDDSRELEGQLLLWVEGKEEKKER